jgi:4-diphosphocytidyl-2-C-methyl-D-erythritol kinase
VIRAYAKVNLTLEVLRRRDDGYHDVASVVHTISLADELYIEPAEEIVTLDDNLVARAAHMLAAATHTRPAARLRLHKRIPIAAGLGGGSSDAASTLVGLNRLWKTRLDYPALLRLAAELGSDVPFFIRGGAALMSGRGEQLRALPPLIGQWLVLAVPEQSLPDKTARLYRALQPNDFSSGAASAALASRLEQGQSLVGVPLVNAFERAARAEFEGLNAQWAALERTCGVRFHLSGAGPALFALVANSVTAREMADRVEVPGVTAHPLRTVRHGRASVRLNSSVPIEYP